ncbi:MAG: helix-turn-helix domain-containing protein [Oscillospiraceae bacterium]|nr:helix-turn-helix domain-containing protein [Oscillospiraceae bacterium]
MLKRGVGEDNRAIRGVFIPEKARDYSHDDNFYNYNDEIDFIAIGQKLKKERRNIGWTQEKVAEAIGVTTAFVGHIERGEKSMSLDTLINLCNFYRITIDYVLSDTLPTEDNNTIKVIAAMLRDKSEEQQAAIVDILRSVTRHI